MGASKACTEANRERVSTGNMSSKACTEGTGRRRRLTSNAKSIIKFEIGRLNIKYVKARLFKTCYGGR